MLKIQQALEFDISTGKYGTTGRLPGVRELAQHFGCSRGTVSNALKELSRQGLIRTEQGRGTFVSAGNAAVNRRSGRMIGAVLLWNSYLEEMEQMRNYYLQQGWFLSLYCSSNDLQDPEAERRFLQLALEQNFAGVMLTATPLEPLNTDLYRNMRRAGMKVLHLTHYKEDMSGEPAILPDYRLAGSISCSAAAMQGKKKIVCIRSTPVNPPSTLLRIRGAKATAKALGLEILPDLCIRTHRWNLDVSPQELKSFFEKAAPLHELAMLFNDCAMLHEVRTVLDSAGIPPEKQPFMLSMSDTHPRKESMNHIVFDYKKCLRLAMDYMTDNSISPLENFTHLLEPELVLMPECQNTGKSNTITKG